MLKMFCGLALTALFLITLPACGGGGDDDTSGNQPHQVTPPAPVTNAIAVTSGNNIKLSWTPSTDPVDQVILLHFTPEFGDFRIMDNTLPVNSTGTTFSNASGVSHTWAVQTCRGETCSRAVVAISTLSPTISTSFVQCQNFSGNCVKVTTGNNTTLPIDSWSVEGSWDGLTDWMSDTVPSGFRPSASDRSVEIPLNSGISIWLRVVQVIGDQATGKSYSDKVLVTMP